jgi:hypothetical protein
MNHASRLQLPETCCGKRVSELDIEGGTDRCLAALTPDTQSQVDCPDCRRRLGLPVAWMRVLGVPGVNDTPLTIEPIQNQEVVVVRVPGFGHMVVTKSADAVNGDQAMMTRGPGTEHARPVTRNGNLIEVEMLHKADRLTVCVELPGA